MREVTMPPLAGRPTSCLGFGCASLGSRVSAGQGARALARAYDGGVRWFDVAPAYGGGLAEPILGDFIKDRRDQVQICTKVGLLPPSQGPLKRLARDMLRPAVALAGPLRAMIRKSGATANRSVTLTPALLHASLERSLTRLGTDYVDVYALHNADPRDLARDDILRVLEELKAAGKTRSIGVAGDADAAAAAVRAGAPFGLVQMAQPLGAGAGVPGAAQAGGMGCVTHTVFGVAGQLARLKGLLEKDTGLRSRLADAGYDGPPQHAAAALLMARAFAGNPQGVVLASMFSDRSLAGNLAAAAAPLDPAAPDLCAQAGL